MGVGTWVENQIRLKAPFFQYGQADSLGSWQQRKCLLKPGSERQSQRPVSVTLLATGLSITQKSAVDCNSAPSGSGARCCGSRTGDEPPVKDLAAARPEGVRCDSICYRTR